MGYNFTLFNALTDAIEELEKITEELKNAQNKAEEEYVKGEE